MYKYLKKINGKYFIACNLLPLPNKVDYKFDVELYLDDLANWNSNNKVVHFINIEEQDKLLLYVLYSKQFDNNIINDYIDVTNIVNIEEDKAYFISNNNNNNNNKEMLIKFINHFNLNIDIIQINNFLNNIYE